MKKLRKVNSQKRKQKSKEAQERLEEQTALIMKHPTACCLCDSPFERTEETVKSWQVTINESRVRLSCPSCTALVRKTVEDHTHEV